MVLEVLTGVPLPDDMPGKSCLLYRCLNKVEFVEQMPSFDEWGPRPVGLVGPRENPIIVVPLLATSPDLAPRVDAGGQAPSEAGGASAEVSMPPEALEASSSGTRDPYAGAGAEGATQSAAPEAEASVVSAGHHGAEPEGSPKPSAHEAASSGASLAAPCAGCHIQRFGRLRVDFKELRKRKGSPSCSSSVFGPLKRRKYIAIDE